MSIKQKQNEKKNKFPQFYSTLMHPPIPCHFFSRYRRRAAHNTRPLWGRAYLLCPRQRPPKDLGKWPNKCHPCGEGQPHRCIDLENEVEVG
jgi:hypothetical protein